jgi:hypothetical protein
VGVVIDTVADPLAVTGAPPGTEAVTVTVSVWLVPGTPVKSAWNVQAYWPPPGATTVPAAQVPRPARSPWTSPVMVTDVAPVLVTRTPNVKLPPGAGRLVGSAVFATVIDAAGAALTTTASAGSLHGVGPAGLLLASPL